MTAQTEFINEAGKYIGNERASILSYIKVLEKASSNRSLTIATMVLKFLSLIRENSSRWTNYENTQSSFDKYANDFAEQSTGGYSYDDAFTKQNKRILTSLGSLFSSDQRTPLYFMKKTADIIEQDCNNRLEILQSIIDRLGLLKTELNMITPEWYNHTSVTDAESAVNDVDNAILNLTVAGSHSGQYSSANIGELGLARSRALSAVDYLARSDMSSSIFDMMFYLDELYNDTSSLEILDSQLIQYITNIKTGRESFIQNIGLSGKFLTYMQETIKMQKEEMSSISKSMHASLDTNSEAIIASNTREWINRLSVLAASIESSLINYSSVITDETHEDTAQLIVYANDLAMPDRIIDTTLVSTLKAIISLSRQKIVSNTNITIINNLIDGVLVSLTNQLSNTANIISDSTSYDPTELSQIDEVILFTKNLGLDRANSLLISSNWPEILTLDENNMSYSDVLAKLILSFIDSVEDVNVKSVILSMYYMIQSQKRKRSRIGITFDTLRELAIASLKNNNLRQLDIAEAQISSINGKI